MHNFRPEQNIDWRDEYWYNKIKHGTDALGLYEAESSVETVIKKRDKEAESKDFFQAQLDITKDILPAQTMADIDHARLDLFDQQLHKNEDFAKAGKMFPTPLDAYNVIYPSENSVPVSAAMKPTSNISTAEYPASGYRGDGVPQGKIGSLELETKADTSRWIGDHFLPKETQDNKDTFTPPVQPMSSAGTWGDKPFLNLGDLLQEYLNKK